MGVCACNPSVEGVEIGGSLKLSGWLANKPSQVVKPKPNKKTLKNYEWFLRNDPQAWPPASTCKYTHVCVHSQEHSQMQEK